MCPRGGEGALGRALGSQHVESQEEQGDLWAGHAAGSKVQDERPRPQRRAPSGKGKEESVKVGELHPQLGSSSLGINHQLQMLFFWESEEGGNPAIPAPSPLSLKAGSGGSM